MTNTKYPNNLNAEKELIGTMLLHRSETLHCGSNAMLAHYL